MREALRQNNISHVIIIAEFYKKKNIFSGTIDRYSS